METFKRNHNIKPNDEVPERKAEGSFLEEKPEQEIMVESSAEQIIAEVKRKHLETSYPNNICFFKYRGADLKIGQLRGLGKLEYEIRLENKSIDGYELYRLDNFEKVVAQIIDIANEFIDKK